MARTRIGLIGLGMAVKPHAGALRDLSDRVEVLAWSPSAERRAAFHAATGLGVVDSPDAILADPTVAGVGILTPANTHLELTERVAAAGKHVLLEKPIEIDISRSEATVAAARARGVKLGIVLQHRFRPAAERLRAILEAGELGRIVNCSTSIRLWRPQAYYDEPGRGTRARDGGGVLLTQGIHTLDLMLSLAGPVAEVRSFAVTSAVHRMETEDLVAAAVRFESGAIGVIDATTAAYPGAAERIEFAGTKGAASLVGTSLAVDWHDGRSERHAADGSAGGTGADPMAFPHDYHLSVWADFLDAIRDDRDPRVTGEEALKVHELIGRLVGN